MALPDNMEREWGGELVKAISKAPQKKEGDWERWKNEGDWERWKEDQPSDRQEMDKYNSSLSSRGQGDRQGGCYSMTAK